MRRFINYIKIIVIAFLVVATSRFGWLLITPVYKPTIERQNELSATKAELKDYVLQLTEVIGDRNIINNPDSLNQAVEYISDTLDSFGYDVKYQEYNAYNRKVKNIYVIKKSDKQDAKTIVLGAHYDTFSNPGADDNASGVAGVLAIAKKLQDKKVDNNIHFVFFVNEEPPFFHSPLMGSSVYVKALKQNDVDVKGGIILEMIGYYSDDFFSQEYPSFIGPLFPNKGNFIAFVANFESYAFLKQFKGSFKKRSKFPYRSLVAPASVNGVDFSDHWSFWQEAYPAIMVTDTAFFRNKNYHKQTDTYETLNYSYMAELVAGISDMLINNDI